MRHRKRSFPGAAIAAWFCFAAAMPAGAARVDSFAPQGTAKQVRQVSARFSEPMVPLGDPRSAADPFAIDCAPKGSARWADARTWVLTFDADLPAGVRCRFTLKRDARTLAGATIDGPREFAFSTGGPAIVNSAPWSSTIDEDQRFALQLDAPATRESIEAHAVVRVGGLPDPIGMRVVEGADRDAILASLDWKPDDPRIVVLEARQRFAHGAKLTLSWGAGIATASGVATETEQVFEYQVRPDFTVRLWCERENAKAGCVPLRRFSLSFSTAVPWESASRIVLRQVAEGGAAVRTWQPRRGDPSDGDPLVDYLLIDGPFPPRAKFTLELPTDLRDAAGRALDASRSTITVATDRYPPLAKFSAKFGVVESASPVLPVALRHVGADATLRGQDVTGSVAARSARVASDDLALLLAWLNALAIAENDASIFAMPGLAASPQPLALPPTQDGDEAEVVGIPLAGPGLHIVEIESKLLGTALLDPPGPLYVAAGAFVTNLAVHFKWGRESSLVWVTTLDTAQPVAGAAVSVANCDGAILAQATTDTTGVARIAGLPNPASGPRCGDSWTDYKGGLLVLAKAEDQLGIVHTSWQEGIESWRFGFPTEWRPNPTDVHTVFDRTLLRAGDTLHMKHVLRAPVLAGFAQVPPEQRPERLEISHSGSDDKYELPLAWEANGSALSEWKIPRQAKLGVYSVRLVPRNPSEYGADSGSFRVEEFRVPLMRGVLSPPRDAVVAADEFPLDLAVQHLSGGGASLLPVTLRTQIRSRTGVQFAGFDDFAFAQGGVTEGVRRRSFGESEPEWKTEWLWGEAGSLGAVWQEPKDAGADGPVATQELKLDAAGTTRAILAGLPHADRPLDVQAELEFRDPSGEVSTSSRTIPIWPASRVVGLRAAGAKELGKPLEVEGAVLDLDGQPLRLAGVAVDAYERRSYAARKRMVGGFYAYENVEEVRRIGPFCWNRSDRSGRFRCTAPPPIAGELVLVARSSDWSGREAVTNLTVYVAGDDDDWFAQGEGDRIDLVPEKPRYEPGDTARFQVRMPFRAATALVSVEREGVAESFVTTLSGKDPVVEVPVLGTFAPNVYVSVLAVRGREAEPAPTGVVDLAKPAYRLGIAEIRVGERDNELAVRVEPGQSSYRVRETAQVRIAVRTPDGAPPPPGAELAIAAIDEGLLELWPNTSWNLLDAMMGRRAYAVQTSTALMQVIGKRHFGRKAVPSGGGGGKQATRELFDTLLLWKGRVPLDAAGDAQIEIPLNDSLTSFRIAAVATGGDSRFGSGEASIRTTQELMILAGLPQFVREGDRFAAGVTLRNTTDTAQDVTLRATVAGLPAPLAPIEVALQAGESRESSWSVDVPTGVTSLDWRLDVESTSGIRDQMKITQRVAPAVPVRVLQATLLQVVKNERLDVERPAGALPGRGGLDVALRPSLAAGRDGIDRAMREYSYICLEQQASVAIALQDTERWRGVMDVLPSYLDSDGFARFFPVPSPGSEVLTSFLLAIANEAKWEIPAAPRERMLAALTRFVEGGVTRRETVRAADLPLRKLAAVEALARYGRATPALVTAIAIEPMLLTNGGLLDWVSVLDRVPAIERRDARLAEANTLLRSRLDVQGTTLGFATGRGGVMDWLLATSDVNATKLVLSRLHAPTWREEVPRLMRAALSLQRHGAWPTTTANAWGVLALEGFSRVYETVPVTGTTKLSLAATERRVAWAATPQGEAVQLAWPDARAVLALQQDGSGAPWALVQSLAALPLSKPLENGYRIEKTWEPVSQRTPGQWSRGDVARVRISVDADAQASWVVLSDPIPAGSTLLGRGLGGDQLLARNERDAGAAWEAYTERGLEVFRRYYEFAPKGTFVAEYTVRLNQSGRFELPPTRVAAMYAPERTGERPNAAIEVAP
jgi:hypothetical protein